MEGEVRSIETEVASCLDESSSQVYPDNFFGEKAVVPEEAIKRIQFGTEREDHGLFPRDGISTPKKWQKHVDHSASNLHYSHTPVSLGQVPQPYKGIYQKCKETLGDSATDRKITSCIISTAVRTFPPKNEFKAASIVAFDLLNKAFGVYTVESVLGAAVECKERKTNKSSKKPRSLDERVAKCFFKSLMKMHPLGDYAFMAIQRRKGVKGYFQQVAKFCHDNMPENLKGRRDVKRYYGKCFIDTVSAKYENNMLVKRGKQWLIYYIEHPDSKFNQEKLLDIAEYCEDKTKNFPPNKKRWSAFFCFFRSLLSLHPRTKLLADLLVRWERTHPHAQHGDEPTNNHQDTTPKQHYSETENTGSRSPKKSIMPFGLDKFVSPGAGQRSIEDLPQCLMRAVTMLSPVDQVMGSLKNAASNYLPSVRGIFGKLTGTATPQTQGAQSLNPTNMFKREILQSFVEKATPCLGLYKQDKDGKLVLDRDFATSAAVEAVKLHPMGALAVGAAEALANNVSVTEGKDGKPQYDVNYYGLARGLGSAAFQSTKIGRIASKFM